MTEQSLVKILALFLAATLWSCSTTPVLLQERANPIRLQEIVSFLSDSIGGRGYQQYDALKRSHEYIMSEFSKIGLKCSTQTYYVEDLQFSNAFCFVDGETDSLFIIGAHYDTFLGRPGADDNASGIAGIIETARLVSRSKKPYYTLVFVAFTLEESHSGQNMGSYQFAQLVKSWDKVVAGMTSLEMIGYFTEEKQQEYPFFLLKLFYPSQGNFIAAVSNLSSSSLADTYQRNAEALQEIDCVQFSAPASLFGVDRSDHLNFWEFGYDAFMITDTAFLRNKNYHTERDKSIYLDYKRMSFVVNALANMALSRF